VSSGVVPATDDDVAADRYVMADEILGAAGYEWYEVSNWALSAKAACRHNELYWSDANWWGFGPGAHSHVSGVRWWNVKHPTRYAAALEAGRSPAAGRETLDTAARYTERIMLGVRMRSGLPAYELTDHARGALPQLASWGLIDTGLMNVGQVVLTQRGRLMADAVVRELLS
jgi:oxygen-independent coproporphyrinogen-3 oxidase